MSDDTRKIEANMEVVGNYFSRWEFACRGVGCCGHSASIDPVLVVRLDKLRDLIGGINPSSGFRCYVHNQSVGSADTSQHPRGKACDIPHEGRNVQDMSDLARSCGFSGIGIYNWGIHVDVRQGNGDITQWDAR